MMEDTESQELDVSALNLQPDENDNEPNKFVDSSHYNHYHHYNPTTEQHNRVCKEPNFYSTDKYLYATAVWKGDRWSQGG